MADWSSSPSQRDKERCWEVSRLFPLALVVVSLFLAGCTSLAPSQELKAKDYCQEKFSSICNIQNSTCVKEGLVSCTNAEYGFHVTALNETKVVFCSDATCLHK